MDLRQLDDTLIRKVASWLSDDSNAVWLDFRRSMPEITRPLIKYMSLKETNALRVFTDDHTKQPIGIVALSDINHIFHSAMLWFVLGEKVFRNKNYTTRAVSKMIRYSLKLLHLHSIHA